MSKKMPLDVPEGIAAKVLMSATIFQQWVDEHPEIEIVDWGEFSYWSGMIYDPVLRRETKTDDRL